MTTFTQHIPGTYDAVTDTFTAPSVVTVTGAAIQVKGNPLTYQALELLQTEAPTLLFTPDTYGTLPALGSSVVWGNVTYTVRSIDPLQPDGVPILARIVVAR